MPSFEAEITTTVEVDFEVFCAKCGAGLCSQSTGGNTTRRRQPYVSVEPCERCLEAEYDKGHTEGYAEGSKDGYDSGYEEGYHVAE